MFGKAVSILMTVAGHCENIISNSVKVHVCTLCLGLLYLVTYLQMVDFMELGIILTFSYSN